MNTHEDWPTALAASLIPIKSLMTGHSLAEKELDTGLFIAARTRNPEAETAGARYLTDIEGVHMYYAPDASLTEHWRRETFVESPRLAEVVVCAEVLRGRLSETTGSMMVGASLSKPIGRRKRKKRRVDESDEEAMEGFEITPEDWEVLEQVGRGEPPDDPESLTWLISCGMVKDGQLTSFAKAMMGSAE